MATRLRRTSQIVFLLFFVWLLLRTKTSSSSGSGNTPSSSVNLFFKLDPLACLVNVLAGHTLYRGLAWSLVILIPTFVLGRFFCGWVCPIGSMNHFLGGIRSGSRPRKELIAATHSLEEIHTYLRVDSLSYLSVEGMMKAVEGTPQGHCTACFTAKYPVPFDEETEKYSLESKC